MAAEVAASVHRSLAAEYGLLEALQLLCANGYLEEELYLCEEAAKGGHVHVLEWLREQGAPWGDTCGYAAIHGQLDTLKWARERGAPWDEDVCPAAAYNGCPETLQWLVASGCPFDRQRCLDIARQVSNTEMVQWLEQLV